MRRSPEPETWQNLGPSARMQQPNGNVCRAGEGIAACSLSVLLACYTRLCHSDSMATASKRVTNARSGKFHNNIHKRGQVEVEKVRPTSSHTAGSHSTHHVCCILVSLPAPRRCMHVSPPICNYATSTHANVMLCCMLPSCLECRRRRPQ